MNFTGKIASWKSGRE